jgi:hypothetical protein
LSRSFIENDLCKTIFARRSLQDDLCKTILAGRSWRDDLGMSSRDRLSPDPKPKSGWRRAIAGLGPYQSLALLAVPLCVVEPAKLVAVAIAGKGHWITGTGMIVAAYAVSILVVERLFLIVKPKLLTLDWFAWFWTRFVALRDPVVRWFTCRTTAPHAQSDRR